MKSSLLFAPFRQRLPFLGLLVCATSGIVVADWLPVSSTFWLLASFGLAALFCFRRRLAIFIPLVICAFATMHLWQSRESPARELAARLGDDSLLVTATGLVTSPPRAFENGRAGFDFRISSFQRGSVTLSPSIDVTVDWIGPLPAYGDEIRLTGALTNLEPPRNPGQFNFAAWLNRRGIFSSLRIEHPIDADILHHDRGNPIIAFALKSRDWMQSTLTLGINDPLIADLLSAMILGNSSSLPQQVQEQFRGTGTFHLFSVSGLHVAMLAVLLWNGVKIFRISRRQSVIVVIPALFFYALMTGWQPASVRSAVMASIVLAGFFADRPPTVLNNLCAAAFLILCYDTNELFNPGFQLSFIVVAALILFSEPLTAFFQRPFQIDPFLPEKLVPPIQRFARNWAKKFAALCGVSAAAWIGSLPLTLGYFHLVSLTSMPANLVAIPISFGIMAVAMLSLCSGVFSFWLASVFNQTNWFLTKVLLATVQFFASLPGSYCYIGPPPPSDQIAELTVFDFGSGGATCVMADGRAWMIDSGPEWTYDSTLLRFFRMRGLISVDGLILTHGDAEHISGARPMLDSCPPDLLVESPLDDRSPARNGIRKELEKRRIPKSLSWAGDRFFPAKDVEMEILFPPKGLQRSSANDEAFVLRVVAGKTRILLMSDAGFVTENWLLEHVADKLPCDVIIKGSARAEPSGDPAFLDAVRPSAIIATAANFPPDEQIDPGWEQELASRGIKLFRQDQTGAVIIRVFTHGYEITGFANKQQFRSP